MNDKYVFETESSRKMEIVASRHKILSVLDDIKNWRRELYKGYDNNVRILCNGKLYTYTDILILSLKKLEMNYQKMSMD